MKISIILGTRPEIIKMSLVIRECEKRGLDYFILHTGEHYSYSLDKIFFEGLELPRAKYNLDVGSGTHTEENGKMLMGIEKVLLDERPDVVLVEGDTNTVLKVHWHLLNCISKLETLKQGLRSYDIRMPEEHNRRLIDYSRFKKMDWDKIVVLMNKDPIIIDIRNIISPYLVDSIGDKYVCR